MKHSPKPLGAVCKALGVALSEEHQDIMIDGIATLDAAQSGELSFLSNMKYAHQASSTQATAILVKKGTSVESSAILLECEDPYLTFTVYLIKLDKELNTVSDDRENAQIAPDAIIGEDCIIETGAIIASGATIGNGCRIGTGAKILPAAVIGDRVVIEAGAVIGSQGFGFAPDATGTYHAIPQMGKAVLENDVFIGANTTVDRGALTNTVVGEGSKIDNQCMIAHGVTIGKNTVMAAQTGVAGSTSIGDNCKIAGQVGIAGHLKIGDNVTILAQTGVMADVKDNKVIFGTPALDRRHFLKSFSAFKKQGL